MMYKNNFKTEPSSVIRNEVAIRIQRNELYDFNLNQEFDVNN